MEHLIQLGDKAYPIRMKLGVFEHLKDITGQDGIAFVQDAGTNITFGMYALLLAGMLCYQDKHKDKTVDKEAVLIAVKSEADISDFTKLIGIYAEFMNPGEAQAQEKATQSPGQDVKNSGSDF